MYYHKSEGKKRFSVEARNTGVFCHGVWIAVGSQEWIFWVKSSCWEHRLHQLKAAPTTGSIIVVDDDLQRSCGRIVIRVAVDSEIYDFLPFFERVVFHNQIPEGIVRACGDCHHSRGGEICAWRGGAVHREKNRERRILSDPRHL